MTWPEELIEAVGGSLHPDWDVVESTEYVEWRAEQAAYLRAVLDAALAYRDADGLPVLIERQRLLDQYGRTTWEWMAVRAEAAEARVEELAAELDAIPPHKRAWRFDVQRLEARVEALTALTDPHRVAQRITEAACKCGHRWRNHDPEDGDCESLDTINLRKCPCRSYRSPSPDHTTAEWLTRAALGVPVVPQACPSCGSTDPKVRGRTDYGGTWGYWYCRDAWHVSPKESQPVNENPILDPVEFSQTVNDVTHAHRHNDAVRDLARHDAALRTDRDLGISFVAHLIGSGYKPGCPTCSNAWEWAAMDEFPDLPPHDTPDLPAEGDLTVEDLGNVLDAWHVSPKEGER